mgnify:CR=1 FL=1
MQLAGRAFDRQFLNSLDNCVNKQPGLGLVRLISGPDSFAWCSIELVQSEEVGSILGIVALTPESARYQLARSNYFETAVIETVIPHL